MKLNPGGFYLLNIILRNSWCEHPEVFAKINNHPFIYHHPVTFLEVENMHIPNPFQSYLFKSHLDLYALLKENSDYDMFSYLVNTCQLTHTQDNTWEIRIFKDRFKIINPNPEPQTSDQ
jgi:hypothetical protein